MKNAWGARREMGIEQFKGHQAHDNPIDRNANQNDTNYTYSSKGNSNENKNHSKVNYLWIANLTEVGVHFKIILMVLWNKNFTKNFLVNCEVFVS